MLTKEILQANAALSGLTDEQLDAIATLSRNDENSVIAQKTGEIYGGLDRDILEVSGMEKIGTEKTYDYAKRVLGELKTKSANVDDLHKEIDGLKREKSRLEKTIADGAGDAETAKALKNAKADLEKVTGQYAELTNKLQQIEENHAKEIFGIRVSSELEAAAAGVKFKAGFSDSVKGVILNQAREKIAAMSPEYIDDGEGGKVIAFKGEDGAVLRNVNNQLKPYTAAELFRMELEKMSVLEEPRQTTGGGTSAPTGGGSGSAVVISARTQVEANDLIDKALMDAGMVRNSKEFDAAKTEAWKTNNVSSLPER